MPEALSSKDEADKILEQMKGTDFGEYLAIMRQEASEGNTEKLNEVFNAFKAAVQSKPGNKAD
ncbi:hypothetical protein ADINL_2957 [Nitrincola lacisaponensis]|uniref:Uncharacterized protein n=2 Tax=Nitrincola lacisaponensis TaxID=267850 RepID=A0A063Y1Y8_9GAMM|nr:hypothetical protein ADINL_2957 [Nitrincola lacisaponensis]